jgi:hypothetical protein
MLLQQTRSRQRLSQPSAAGSSLPSDVAPSPRVERVNLWLAGGRRNVPGVSGDVCADPPLSFGPPRLSLQELLRWANGEDTRLLRTELVPGDRRN